MSKPKAAPAAADVWNKDEEEDEEEEDEQDDGSDEDGSDDDDSKAPAAAVKTKKAATNIQGLVQVLPYLYLGGAHAASKADVLKENGIVHIMNCVSQDVDNFFPEEFKYTTFEIPDDRNFDISEHFQEAFDVIKSFRDGDHAKRVLIHDETGQSQAVALLLAYMLMSAKEKQKQLTLKAALSYVTGKKGDVQPNPGFIKHLINLEKDLYGEASLRVKNSGGRGGARRRGGGGGRGKRMG